MGDAYIEHRYFRALHFPEMFTTFFAEIKENLGDISVCDIVNQISLGTYFLYDYFSEREFLGRQKYIYCEYKYVCNTFIGRPSLFADPA